MDGVYGTGIHAGATVDAGISVNNTLGPLLADSVYWAGIFTCCAIGAVFGNSMGHGFTSL